MLTFEWSVVGGIEGEPAPKRSSRNDAALTEKTRFRLLPGALRRDSRRVGAHRGVTTVPRAARSAIITGSSEGDAGLRGLIRKPDWVANAARARAGTVGPRGKSVIKRHAKKCFSWREKLESSLYRAYFRHARQTSGRGAGRGRPCSVLPPRCPFPPRSISRGLSESGSRLV